MQLGRLWLRSLVMHGPALLHDPVVRARSLGAGFELCQSATGQAQRTSMSEALMVGVHASLGSCRMKPGPKGLVGDGGALVARGWTWRDRWILVQKARSSSCDLRAASSREF